MVMHGPVNWVFAKMIDEYRKHASKEFEIMTTTYPTPKADVHQYWRPMFPAARQNNKHLKTGIHMVHDSPGDGIRSRNRQIQMRKYHSVMCTSMEQFNTYQSFRRSYVPLGVFEGFKKPKEVFAETDQKLKIGWNARKYRDGVKNEELLIQIARNLDPRKYSFVIVSPNAQKEVRILRNLGFLVVNNDKPEELMREMDIQLVLSKHEGTPFPLIEGLSIGNHVLSRPVGESTVLLDEDCICDNVKDFVGSIEKVYEDRTILKDSLENNPKKVEDRTWERHVKLAEDMWREVIGK